MMSGIEPPGKLGCASVLNGDMRANDSKQIAASFVKDFIVFGLSAVSTLHEPPFTKAGA
jgi:hypothetical protein